MRWVEAVTAISERVLAGYSTTDLVLENETYDGADGTPYARLTVLVLDRQQISLGAKGSRKYETRGEVDVEVFHPRAGSLRDAINAAQELADLFEGERVGELTFFEGEPKDLPPDGNYLRKGAKIEFIFQETR